MVNLKIYDNTDWITNNCKTHLPNISRSKGNQGIKFGQLIKYSVRNIFVQKPSREWGNETSSRPTFLFKKALYTLKASG